LSVVTLAFPQSGAVIPQGGAGHADKASCIILKRMGPADEITSHLYSFGIRGKQFQYVEGKFPDGFPFHGRLTDHDVRNLQGRGAEVVVVNQDFTAEDLRQARSDCKTETGKTPNQADATVPSSKPAEASSAAPVPASAATDLSVSSSPSGADIEVDGKFVGSTPSSIRIGAGDHSIAVKKKGFAVWNRNITASGGNVTINAELEEAPHSVAAVASVPASVVSSEQAELIAVSITSDPDGAAIFVDSKGMGSAPRQLQLKTGSHSIVIVKQGYKDWGTKLVVERGATPTVNAKLEK
jgi:hypothetical protein